MRTPTGCYTNKSPKAMVLLDVTPRQVLETVHKLGNKPKKCLCPRMSYEVSHELSSIDTEKLVGYVHIIT